jgi:hypothetical protein
MFQVQMFSIPSYVLFSSPTTIDPIRSYLFNSLKEAEAMPHGMLPSLRLSRESVLSLSPVTKLIDCEAPDLPRAALIFSHVCGLESGR